MPDSVGAESGLSFPVGAWAAHDGATEFYWLGSPVDDVVVEGCNDGAISGAEIISGHANRHRAASITGSAELGSDYLVSLEEIVFRLASWTRLCCCSRERWDARGC